jgi:site-specific DNA-methyltransferase (adenine-specific)
MMIKIKVGFYDLKISIKGRYTLLELNKIYCTNNIEGMKLLDDNSIDLTVTSPPYDDLRNYKGYTFDFENLAKELYRVTKVGGVVVWVVGDATKNGSESGTSFKQALYFTEIGFNLHDTMIWNKGGFTAVGALSTRYAPVFEYMFILTKGKIKTFNPIKDRITINGGKKVSGTIRQKDGSTKPMSKVMTINKYSQRYNIWNINPQRQRGKYTHPAVFPEQLAEDHILSWSNVGDIVLDPFMGSGTTAKMAKLNNRNFIGFEISQEYCDIANKRLENL